MDYNEKELLLYYNVDKSIEKESSIRKSTCIIF